MITLRRLTVAAALVILSGLVLGKFGVATLHGVDSATYHVNLDRASWVGDSNRQVLPRNWLRLVVPVNARPSAATLWVDAEQAVHVSVDGVELANNETDVHNHTARVLGVPLASQFTPGSHVVGLTVINYDHGRPALVRARLTLTVAGVTTEYETGSAPWRATSDAALAYAPPVVDDNAFSRIGFLDTGWDKPAVWPSPRGDIGSPVPEWALETAPTGHVITSPDHGMSLTASTTLHVDDGNDAWVRVAGTGAITVNVNGSTVIDNLQRGLKYPVPRVNGRGVPVADLIHLSSVLHEGDNRLTVTVRSSVPAALWLDGRLHEQVGEGAQPISTDATWLLPDGGPVATLGTPVVTWGAVPPVALIASSSLIRPWSVTVPPILATVALALLLWVILGFAGARLTGLSPVDHLGMAAAGSAPGSALVVALEQLGQLPSFEPPGVHRPWVLIAVIVVTVGGAALSLLAGIPALARALRAVVTRAAIALLARPRRFLAFATAAAAGGVARAFPAVRGSTGGGGVAEADDPGTPRRRFRVRLTWAQIAVVATAFGTAATYMYQLGYETLWQDELFSVAAARGIRQHVLPIWPSGFQYWKGELYEVLLAVVGGIFGDDKVVLRMVSMVFFVLTILAFGLVLMPRLLGSGRGWLIAAATLIFATMPLETEWARQIRMYQMAQLFIVLFLAVFWTALRKPTTRSIVGSCALVILMYLSHEETFIFFPAVGVIGLIALRSRLISDRRWLIGGSITALVIAGQYLLSVVTHPPVLGYDQSNRPFVQFATDDPFFYLAKVYFMFGQGTLAVLSGFAVIATIVGIRRRCPVRLYLAAFSWITLATMSLVFTQRYPRYAFVTLPAFFLLGLLGVLDVVGITRRMLGAARESDLLGRFLQRSATSALAGLLMVVTLSMIPNVEALGIAATRLTNAPETAVRLDYDYVAQYIRLHQQPGDIFITHAPSNIPAEYLGRPPDYVLQPRISQRLLYVFEKNGQPVDTQYGAPMLLASDDLTRLMEAHHRIWLVGDTAHPLSLLPPGFQNLILLRFRLVCVGARAQAYLFS